MNFYKIETLKQSTGQLKVSAWFVKQLGCNISTLLKYNLIKKEGSKGYYRVQITSDFDTQAFLESRGSNHPWRKTNPVWKRKAAQKQKRMAQQASK